jgi:two-component system, OmpR family, sensor kinase
VEVRVFAENGVVAVRVADSGDGIEASDLERIWDRFYRVEKSRRRQAWAADGAGLGLAIVRGIVEAHGGTVDVASKRRHGTAFTARLPRD